MKKMPANNCMRPTRKKPRAADAGWLGFVTVINYPYGCSDESHRSIHDRVLAF